MEQKLGIKFTKQFYGSATQQIDQLLPLYMTDAELAFVLEGEERIAHGPIEIQRTLSFFLHRSISVKAISTRAFEPFVIIQCSGLVDQESPQPYTFHHCFVLKRMDPTKNLFCINRELLHVMKDSDEKKTAPSSVGPVYTGLPKAAVPPPSAYQPPMQQKMGMSATVPVRPQEVPPPVSVQPINATSPLTVERSLLLVPAPGSQPINERGVSDAVSFVVRKMREKGTLGAAPVLGLTNFRLVSLAMTSGQAVVEVASPAIAQEMVTRGTLRIGMTMCGIAPLNPSHPSFIQALQQLRTQQQPPVGQPSGVGMHPQLMQPKRGAQMTRPSTAPAVAQAQPQTPLPTAPMAGQKGHRGRRGVAEPTPTPAMAAAPAPAPGSIKTGQTPVEATFAKYVPSLTPAPGTPGFDSYSSGIALAKDTKKAKPKKTAKAETPKPQTEQKTPEKPAPKQKEKKEKKEPTEGEKEKPKPKKEKPPRVATVTTYSSPTTPSESASPVAAAPEQEKPATAEDSASGVAPETVPENKPEPAPAPPAEKEAPKSEAPPATAPVAEQFAPAEPAPAEEADPDAPLSPPPSLPAESN